MSTVTPSRPPRRTRRPRLVAIQVLPTLVTLGNVLAGLLAISYLVDAWGQPAASAAREALWTKAAWVIFFGMLCDALDGRLARMTGAASAFGAELDSLADVVTFGVAPAILGKSIVQAEFPALHPRLVTALAMVYLVGAALRLARYNVESLRVSVPGHVTRVFRGLPSPGAAGVVASLAIFRGTYPGVPGLSIGLLVGLPVLGALMVSRFGYPHLVNRFVGESRSPAALLVLVLVLFLGIEWPEALLGAVFLSYALSGPAVHLARLATGRPRWAVDEEEDEDDDPAAVVAEAEDARDGAP